MIIPIKVTIDNIAPRRPIMPTHDRHAGNCALARSCPRIVGTALFLTSFSCALYAWAQNSPNSAVDPQQLTTQFRQFLDSLARARYSVDQTIYYQNSKQQQELVATDRAEVIRNYGNIRIQYTHRVAQAPQIPDVWEYLYTDNVSLDILRDPKTSGFQQATARLSPQDPVKRREALRLGFSILTDGLLTNNDTSVLEILHSSELTTSTRFVSGVSMVVLTGTSAWGTLDIFFDPRVDNRPVQILQSKRAEDLCVGTTRVRDLRMGGPASKAWPKGRLNEMSVRVDFSSFVKTGRGLVPQFAREFAIEKYESGYWTALTTDLALSNLDLNPTLGESDFIPTTTIPDGSDIEVVDRPGIQYEWRDGNIVKKVSQRTVSLLDSHWYASTSWWQRLSGLLLIVLAALAALWIYRRRNTT